MSQDYYRIIAGKKYDNKMIEIADKAVAGRGDGRISLEDASLLIAAVKDANKYTDIEKATMRYIRDHYRFTPAADKWFRREIRRWAAIRAIVARLKKRDVTPTPTPDAETLETGTSWPETADAAETAEVREQPTVIPPSDRPGPEPPSPPPSPPPVPEMPLTGRQESDRGRKWMIAAGGGVLVVVLVALAFLALRPSRPPTIEPVARQDNAPPIAASESAVAAAGGETVAERKGLSASEPSDPAATILAGGEVGEEREAALEAVSPSPAAPAAAGGENVEEREGSSTAEASAPAANKATDGARRVNLPPEPGTPGGTHNVRKGDTLWDIAKLRYREALLWPIVYRLNRERIPHPDLILPRMQISVPSLQGTASRLTITDRKQVAEGYVEVYQVYRKLGRPNSRLYLLEAGRRDPAVLERYRDQLGKLQR